jgi:hypothetical protein
MVPLGEIIISGCPALRLTLTSAVDESTHHVELSPVDFGGIRGIDIWVLFMRSNEVGHVHLPNYQVNIENRKDKNE